MNGNGHEFYAGKIMSHKRQERLDAMLVREQFRNRNQGVGQELGDGSLISGHSAEHRLEVFVGDRETSAAALEMIRTQENDPAVALAAKAVKPLGHEVGGQKVMGDGKAGDFNVKRPAPGLLRGSEEKTRLRVKRRKTPMGVGPVRTAA
jgi:hypothetical protein